MSVALQPFIDRLVSRSVLNADERQALLALPIQPAAVRAHQDVVRVGEWSTTSCLVADGLLARFGSTREGLRQITALHIPGDMPDLYSVVRPTGLGGLMALADSVVLRVPHTAVRALTAAYPAIAEALWRDCVADAAIMTEWLMNLGQRSALTRLAHLLCEMAIRYSPGDAPLASYAFPITQSQLGEVAGLTGIHVNRTIKTLREQDLATFRNGTVTIPNWSRLARAGDFDPTYLHAEVKEEPTVRDMRPES